MKKLLVLPLMLCGLMLAGCTYVNTTYVDGTCKDGHAFEISRDVPEDEDYIQGAELANQACTDHGGVSTFKVDYESREL